MTAVVDVACPACRAPVFAGSSFCTGCGALLEAPPAVAEMATGVPPAQLGRRLAAYLVDSAVVGGAGASVWALTDSWLLALLIAAELAVGLVLWEARTGKTLGNALLGLRTAKVEAPDGPGLGRAAGRGALLAAGHLALGIGQWLMILSLTMDASGRRQGWHDRAARSMVFHVRQAAQAARVSPAGHAAAPGPGEHTVGELTVGEHTVGERTLGERTLGEHTLGEYSLGGYPGGARTLGEHFSPSHSAIPVGNAAFAPPSPAAYVITLDTGTAMTVSGPGVAGRRPEPVAGEPCDHVVAIDDPGRSLSRTHAKFGIDHGGFWVADNGSTNGTYVGGADGTWVRLAPGQRSYLPQGGAVRLGERTIDVRPAR